MATYLLKIQGKETAKSKLTELNYESSVNAFGLDVGIVGHIMAGYEISRLGKTSAQVQAQFDSVKRQEIVMIWAIYGGIIADALLTDAWVPVYYSSKSALDMLEKNGYLTFSQQKALYQKWGHMPTVDSFSAPKIYTDSRGFLTNGIYRVDSVGMAKHKTGSLAKSKSQFLSTVDAEKAVLDGAAYADKHGLWQNNKATVYINNGPIGVHGTTGLQTNYLNIYKTNSGMVHGAPGSP